MLPDTVQGTGRNTPLSHTKNYEAMQEMGSDESMALSSRVMNSSSPIPLISKV